MHVRLHSPPRPQSILKKAPQIFWTKVNTYGSFTHVSSAYGGIFRNHFANHLGNFAARLVLGSVLHAKVMAIMIMVLEAATTKDWCDVWSESDSKTALESFANQNIVFWDLRNRWSNCLYLGLNIKYSQY
jgi:hypothetical protein